MATIREDIATAPDSSRPEAVYEIGPTEDSLPVLLDLFQRYGDYCRVASPSTGEVSLIVHDPAGIQQVMLTNRNNYTKGIGLERVRVLLGDGIMVSEGRFWQRQRRMMQPGFRPGALNRFAADIRGHCLALAGEWQHAAREGRPVNVTADMSRLALDIILSAIFSEDLPRLEREGGNPFRLLTEESKRDLKFAASFRALRRDVAEIAALRREQGRRPQDFLGLLMGAVDKETSEPMSDKALIDEVMTLIIAGHETTASALGWIWYLLSQHPEADARLYAEIKHLADEQVDPQRARELTYTGWVIKEGLRLYPPGWLLTRRSIESDRIGSQAIAPGTNIFICPYIVQRHPQHWDSPEAFNPQRFGDDGEPHRFAYIPFAAGPRHCIGEHMAMLEMCLHLALLARRFRLEYAGEGEPELEPRINLRPKQPLMMRVYERA